MDVIVAVYSGLTPEARIRYCIEDAGIMESAVGAEVAF